MTDIYTLVCQTAAKLQADGKTPSLALVRAHAGKGLDAAALFSAYQQWRANPPTPSAASTPITTTTTEPDCTAAELINNNEISTLRDEVALLHRKVDQLVQVVEKLSSQLEAANVRR